MPIDARAHGLRMAQLQARIACELFHVELQKSTEKTLSAAIASNRVEWRCDGPVEVGARAVRELSELFATTPARFESNERGMVLVRFVDARKVIVSAYLLPQRRHGRWRIMLYIDDLAVVELKQRWAAILAEAESHRVGAPFPPAKARWELKGNDS